MIKLIKFLKIICLLALVGIYAKANNVGDMVGYHQNYSVQSFFLPSFVLNGIYYQIQSEEDMTASVCEPVSDNKYHFYSGVVNIPSTITYNDKKYTITAIDPLAFRGQGDLTYVVIPPTVKTIGYKAFMYCAQLKTVAFSSTGELETIDYQAFDGCKNITSINIPKSVKTIGKHAFDGCTLLKSIKGGESVETIGGHAFQECTSLTEVVIPSSVKSVGEGIFQNCSALTKVSLGASLEILGGDAFLQCTSLKYVDMPNTLREIGYEAFRYCLSLKNIIIPNSVTTIGYGAFRYCTSLESVTLSNSLKEISAWSFEQTAIKEINIPNTVTDILAYAFQDCSFLEKITFAPGCGLRSISDNAFYGCKNLTNVKIPEPVSSLGGAAFANCDNLSEITLPRTLVTITNKAFARNPKLTKVYNLSTTPQDILGRQIFEDCSKIEVHVYKGLYDDFYLKPGWGDDPKITIIDDIEAAKVSSIVFNNAPYYCRIGQTNKASVTIYPENAAIKELSWSSSDESILYIDEFSGEFIGLSEGSVQITAVATDGSGVKNTSTVYVVTETGISNVKEDEKSKLQIFDLQGRRLKKLQHGIIIVNGKKVIIK